AWQGPESGLFKSMDGGSTWSRLTKGLPTPGDGLGRIGIAVAPSNPKRLYAMVDAPGAGGLYRSDDAGASWRRVHSAQRVCSRGNDGQITFRDWRPVGVEEYGYVAPDPLNPNIIYGGKLTRFDRLTGQVQNVAPEPVRTGKYRALRTAPVLFSPVDPHLFY